MVTTVRSTKIKLGCRQTEIGEIPEDWKITKLGEVADVKTGPFGSTLHEKDYVDDGTPIITVEHLSEQGVVHANLPMVSDFDKKRLNVYSLLQGDIVFSRVGSVDRNSLIKEEESGWLFSGRLLRIRLKTSNVCSPFLSYYFHQEPTKQRIRAVAVGQTMASLNTQILKNVDIAFPPTISEQTAIAAALSDIDALLTSLDQLIAKKRDIKQATMQQLLTSKTRLPGFGGELKPSYKQTEIGMIPEDWEVKKLEDVARIYRGASPRPIEDPKWFNEHSNIGWVRISDVTRSDKYLFNTTQKLSEQGIKHSRFVKQENLIMSICATIGKPIIIKMDVCIHDGFVLFEKPKIKIEYLYYYLSSIEENWSKNGQTGSQMNLNTNIIKNQYIVVPDRPEEQTAIAAVLSDMDAEIVALEQKREKTRALKQGMMQELLTGRIRLL